MGGGDSRERPGGAGTVWAETVPSDPAGCDDAGDGRVYAL